jgi:hypothetical protein
LAEPAIEYFADIEPGIILQWKAFELRPHPVPTLDPNGEYLTGIWQEHVYPLAEKMGFAMKLPSVQPRTRLAHAAAKWAADHGKFNAFNHALFRAFFQDDHDIGKLEILMQIAEKIGLNPMILNLGHRWIFMCKKCFTTKKWRCRQMSEQFLLMCQTTKSWQQVCKIYYNCSS